MFYYDSFGYCTLLEYNVIYFVLQQLTLTFGMHLI